jgi:glycosyltransferase involved in cell wall biosynthesis
MPQLPLISIILPTYNGTQHLQDSIDSCLRQSYANIELIIVNDGSSNQQTKEILSQQTDAKIRIIDLERNMGLPQALNAGFREAHGELLTWTSDDNLFRNNALEVMARELKKSGSEFIYAQAESIDENNIETGHLAIMPSDHLIYDNCIGPCFLFTRHVREETGFYNPEYRLVEDYDYWLRVSQRFPMQMINDDLYLYRFHSKALTSTEGNARIVAARENVRKKYYSRAKLYAADGIKAYARGDYHNARGLLCQSLTKNPFRRDLYKPLLISILPAGVLRAILRAKRLFRE